MVFSIIILIAVILFNIFVFASMAGASEAEKDHKKTRTDKCKEFLYLNSFNIDKKINVNKRTTLYIDSKLKKFLLHDFSYNYANPDKHEDFKLHSFSDIIDVKLYENGTTVQRASIGGALVGGVLAGGVGAIVGSQTTPKEKGVCKSMSVKITIKDVLNPHIQINIIDQKRDLEVKRGSKKYQSAIEMADQVIATFSAMKES